MERPQVPTMLVTERKRVRSAANLGPPVYAPNFGRLATDGSWRNSWAAIVVGRFTPSPYSSLLFVEQSTAYAELYGTDGKGHLLSPSLRQFNPLGGRKTWTRIVPGYFGPSGFTGILLYDQPSGFGRFYDSDGNGNFVLRSEYSGWRTSWTHIVAGRFVASSPYSAVFFYSASENYGEIWATDGKGLVGSAPYQTFPNFWSRPFTHVVAGDFHWTPGFIDAVPTLTDLFFYDAASGRGEMYRCDISPDTGQSNIVVTAAVTSDSLPLQATSVVGGNFGGFGNTDVAFYSGPAGKLGVYCFRDVSGSDTLTELVQHEEQAGLRTSANIVVAGNFWMSDPEDHWFGDGPAVSSTPPFNPDWRYGTGGFSDLLLYDRGAGLGEFYFHEPIPPSPEPLEGYITAQTSHGGASLVSTGSVLPGESIAFHVNSQQGPYTITIYRQGLLDGDQMEQLMAVVDGLPANPTPFLIGRNAYMNGANWPAVATFVVPSWPSGLYVARVQTKDPSPHTVDLPFVVRARPGARSPVVLVLADCTYCSYNDWGGRNSYGHLSGDDFVGAYPSTSALRVPFGFQLSFERPLHGGFGNELQSWEIPFLQWVARRGVPMDVCTSRDLHFEAPDPHQYRLLLFAGHHEYWTVQMRTNVENFVRSGGNLGIFSGNVCWWQIRLSPDGRRLLCYKVAGFDPVSTTVNHALTTVHWFDDLVKRPETTLSGVSWLGPEGIFNDQTHRYVVKQAQHWVFAGTGVQNDDKFGGYGPGEASSVAGPETDRVQTAGPNGLVSPPNYTLASIYNLTGSFEVGSMGLFSPGSGAGQVFNAATINWALGLNRDRHSWNVIDQITLNVIAKLGPPRSSPWTSASEGRSTPGAPITAVQTAPNQVSLVLADPLGGIFATLGNGSHAWGPWTSVSEGQSTPGGHVAAVLTAPGQITLFLADPGGGIYTVSGFPGTGWGLWGSVSEGQSTPGAPVTAVLTGSNQITLFLADPTGGIYTVSGFPGTGWGLWGSVAEGRSTPGAPFTAVLTAPNQITLFLADPVGGIYTASGFPGMGWGPWTSVSEGRSTPGGHVTALLVGNNRVTLFLSDPAGGIYTTSGSAADGWTPWTSVAEGRSVPGAHVSAVMLAPNRIALFMAGPQGGIYTTVGNATDGWRPWTSVSEGRSTPGADVTAILTATDGVALFLADASGGVFTATTVQT